MVMNSIEIAISQLVLATAVFLPIYKLFDFVEENVAAEPKKAISAWLKNIKNSDASFIAITDRWPANQICITVGNRTSRFTPIRTAPGWMQQRIN